MRSFHPLQRSPWKVRGESCELLLVARGDGAVAGAVRLDGHEARWLLARLVPPGAPTHALTAAAHHVLARDAVRLGVRASEAREVVAAALARGLLVGWRVEVRHRASGGGESTEPEEYIPLASELIREHYEQGIEVEDELTENDPASIELREALQEEEETVAVETEDEVEDDRADAVHAEDEVEDERADAVEAEDVVEDQEADALETADEVRGPGASDEPLAADAPDDGAPPGSDEEEEGGIEFEDELDEEETNAIETEDGLEEAAPDADDGGDRDGQSAGLQG